MDYVRTLAYTHSLTIIYTSSNLRTRKLKLKYKRLRQDTTPHGSLDTKCLSGRPRVDYQYRNRFGRKASNLEYKLLHNAVEHNYYG